MTEKLTCQPSTHIPCSRYICDNICILCISYVTNQTIRSLMGSKKEEKKLRITLKPQQKNTEFWEGNRFITKQLSMASSRCHCVYQNLHYKNFWRQPRRTKLCETCNMDAIPHWLPIHRTFPKVSTVVDEVFFSPCRTLLTVL